ncbi:MAG: GntR family transcriptional regulator [Acidimicrobiales bacterium]
MADVTEQLRTDILAGVFLPGTRLVELQLTERYQVGRAAIRSAIVELSAEGLVVHETNRGATVRRVPIDVAVEIAEARAVIEGLLARRAAERATENERAELTEIIAAMTEAVDGQNQDRYTELNRLLHRRIREVSGHSIAAELAANLRNRGTHQEFRLASMPGRSGVSLPQHAAIVAAIVSGDGDVADAAMQSHLGSVKSALLSWDDDSAAAPD